MNRLHKSVAYLSGPMDRVKWKDATGWRDYMKKELWSRSIGVIDPCDKPTPEDEGEDFRARKKKLKENGDLLALHELMKPVVKEDMRFVDLSHFIILYLDADTHICGGYHESCVAAGCQKKPVLTMCPQGLKKIPDWWIGVNPPEMNFESWKDMLDYIDYIDNPDTMPNTHNRWRFLDMEKVYGFNERC
jgi:hypothetical protein